VTSGPLVSIVIPVYNGSNYLREAVDSALAQTYPDVEVLVVNDGSTDAGRTAAVARRYGDRIRYLEQGNGGVAAALNTGVREMRGDYFSWLSHDDVYLPGKVAAQVARLAGSPPGAVLFSDYEFIDASGRVTGTRRFRGNVAAMAVEIVTTDPVHGCTTLIPRSSLAAVGPFDVSLRTAQDYDMWSRLAARFPFVHVPEILLRSRVHEAQGTRTIATHREEAARAHARLVERLTEDDVRAAWPGPPSLGFARIALRLKMRGLDGAAMAALARGRVLAARGGMLERTRFRALAGACALLTRKAKPSHWLGRNLRAPDGEGTRRDE
jgi:glycosyltransferase involved in cell wall biosynthesis